MANDPVHTCLLIGLHFFQFSRMICPKSYFIWPLLVDVGLKFERAEMQMIRWMCDIHERQKDK